MKPKQASISTGLFRSESRPCQYPWPEDCGCQGGEDGIVMTETKLEDVMDNPDTAALVITGQVPHYRTAFFEAFPRNPNTFLRGEGATLADAETNCWNQWLKIQACSGHEFERRHRTDGYAYCKHCGLSGTFLEPTTHCDKCGMATAYMCNHGQWYCEPCSESLAESELDERNRNLRSMIARMNRLNAQ